LKERHFTQPITFLLSTISSRLSSNCSLLPSSPAASLGHAGVQRLSFSTGAPVHRLVKEGSPFTNPCARPVAIEGPGMTTPGKVLNLHSDALLIKKINSSGRLGCIHALLSVAFLASKVCRMLCCPKLRRTGWLLLISVSPIERPIDQCVRSAHKTGCAEPNLGMVPKLKQSLIVLGHDL